MRLKATIAACLAIVLSLAGSRTAAAQALDATRWLGLDEPHIDALLSEVFDAMVSDTMALQHVHDVLRSLKMGDAAQLYFFAYYGSTLEPLYVDLSTDLSTSIRFRSRSEVFQAANRIAEKYWLGSLRPVPTPVRLSIFEANPAVGKRPVITVSVVTEHEFGCTGYSIEGAMQVESSTVDIRLLGVSSPRGFVDLR